LEKCQKIAWGDFLTHTVVSLHLINCSSVTHTAYHKPIPAFTPASDHHGTSKQRAN